MNNNIAPAFCLTADELILKPKKQPKARKARASRGVFQGPLAPLLPVWDKWYKSVGGEWRRVTKQSRRGRK